MNCTGVSAHWCPIHVDCTCKNQEDSLSDDDCQLHSELSDHGEEQEIETVWGPVAFEE